MSNFTEHLHLLRDLTRELHRLNDEAALVYRKRREAIRAAIDAGCYPEQVAASCKATTVTITAAVASLERDRAGWAERDAAKAAERPVVRLGHSDPGDAVTAPEDAPESVTATPEAMPEVKPVHTARPEAQQRRKRRRAPGREAAEVDERLLRQLVTQHDGRSDTRRHSKAS